MAIHGFPPIAASPPTPAPSACGTIRLELVEIPPDLRGETVSASVLGSALHLEISCSGSMVKPPFIFSLVSASCRIIQGLGI